KPWSTSPRSSGPAAGARCRPRRPVGGGSSPHTERLSEPRSRGSMNTQGNGLGESSNAESPQGNANQPTRLDDPGAQVRGMVSTRPKPQTTTGAPAEYLTAGQIAELLQVSEKRDYRWAAGCRTFP